MTIYIFYSILLERAHAAPCFGCRRECQLFRIFAYFLLGSSWWARHRCIRLPLLKWRWLVKSALPPLFPCLKYVALGPPYVQRAEFQGGDSILRPTLHTFHLDRSTRFTTLSFYRIHIYAHIHRGLHATRLTVYLHVLYTYLGWVLG